MKNFVKRLNSGNGVLSFYFNRIQTAHEDRYHVNVVAKDRKLYAFKLKEGNAGWVIENPANCPHWILRMEKSLSNAILEQLAA